MPIKTISVDCDNVIRDFIYGLIFTYKKHFPGHKIIEPITSFHIEDFFPIKEKIYDFFLENAEEVFFANAPIIKDAYKGMKYLHRLGYKIIITTAQKEETIQPTLRWLKKHKIRADKVFNTKEKELVDFDIHIDDDPYQITNIVNAGKRAIIFSTDQNQKIPREIEEKCIRVKSWNEIIDLFEDLQKVESHVKNFTTFPKVSR